MGDAVVDHRTEVRVLEYLHVRALGDDHVDAVLRAFAREPEPDPEAELLVPGDGPFEIGGVEADVGDACEHRWAPWRTGELDVAIVTGRGAGREAGPRRPGETRLAGRRAAGRGSPRHQPRRCYPAGRALSANGIAR